MKSSRMRRLTGLGALIGASALYGCARSQIVAETPMPLGTLVDQVLKQQEENAEAHKFVIYAHEFEVNSINASGQNSGGWKLNEYGQDHLREIASNLAAGFTWPVIIERSQTSAKPETEHLYPVHFSDELDSQRRLVIVESLAAMGIHWADSIVVVAPAFSEGLSSIEAARAYQNSLQNTGVGGGGGMGGGMGGGIGGTFGGGSF